MVLIADIAADLNVSCSLISKVLSGRMGTTVVRPELAETIRRRAAELGYRKNMSAFALHQGRHQAFGVFVHHKGAAGSGIIEELLIGIAAAAAVRKQRMILGFFTTDRACRTLLADVHRGSMDGLLIVGVSHAGLAAELLDLQRSGMPVVTVHDDPLDPQLPNVGSDQERLSRLATEHLIAQGSRLIGHIRDIDSRFRGYQAALQAFGLPCKPEQVFNAGKAKFAYSAGKQAVVEFARRGVAVDGIVAQSDAEAMGCLQALALAGKRVPDDVRVIGIDNAPFCAYAPVPLSSISGNCRLQGQLATELLLQVIDGRKVKSICVPPELVMREST